MFYSAFSQPNLVTLDANAPVFTTTLERGPKRISLLPSLNADKPTVLSILQNYIHLRHCI